MLFNPKLQAYVVGIVDGQRMLVQLEPGAQIRLRSNWATPMDALDGKPPEWVDLNVTGRVANAQVWEDGANPEDLARPELEAPAPQLEQDPDVCPVCGHHRLNPRYPGDYAMSHADWVKFTDWVATDKPKGQIEP